MRKNSYLHSGITIAQVEGYLRKQKWKLDGQIRDIATVWHHENSPDAEVVLPSKVNLRDYSQRMADVLEAIASFEARNASDVVLGIEGLYSSFVSVRVIAADTENGTIPIGDGVLLVSKAKDLLTAAAMAMFSKRRLYTGKPPKDAVEYIDSLLLGQTEVGSYVVNVIAPMRESHGQNVIEGAEPVEGVTLTLARSLDALLEASLQFETSSDPAVFESSIGKGVSANLCDALLGFAGEEQRREFEVKISGASGPIFEGESRVFKYNPDAVEVLKAASRYFKDDYVLTARLIIGLVKKLHRKIDSDVGVATVEAEVNNSVRSIQIELGPEDYHVAILAHDQKKWIECSGDVHVKYRTTRLLNHSGFKTLELGELF